MTAEMTAADIRPSVWMMSLTLRCYYQRIHNYTTLLNSCVFQIEKLSRVLFHPVILKFEQFSHLLLTFFNTFPWAIIIVGHGLSPYIFLRLLIFLLLIITLLRTSLLRFTFNILFKIKNKIKVMILNIWESLGCFWFEKHSLLFIF